MSSAIQISESEWKVMCVLWKNGGLSLGEIIPKLVDNGWNGNTIRTLVIRLVEKGAVFAEKHGRNYIYSAAVSERECVMKETEHFLGRIFDGSPIRLFTALAEGGRLTDKDCAEIESLIREMRERDDK